jgi:hypothetical protein
MSRSVRCRPLRRAHPRRTLADSARGPIGKCTGSPDPNATEVAVVCDCPIGPAPFHKLAPTSQPAPPEELGIWACFLLAQLKCIPKSCSPPMWPGGSPIADPAGHPRAMVLDRPAYDEPGCFLGQIHGAEWIDPRATEEIVHPIFCVVGLRSQFPVFSSVVVDRPKR